MPSVFHQFTGYNRPEMSKHRKRSVGSLSRDILLSHSQSLFGVLHYVFWNRPEWAEVKQSVEQLATSLATYADRLGAKRVRMESVHASEHVVRSIGDCLSLHYTGVRNSCPPYLLPVTDSVTRAGLNQPVELGELLPVDRRRRYDWLMEVKKGLSVPLIHLSYSPGSNIGNLTWIWHTDVSSIDGALQTSQPIIEELKMTIPQYHTRAMRRAAFEKFGLVSPRSQY